MSKVSLLFGVHMHQPVDNFGEAVDEAIELCYKLFFQTMAKYPQFKFSVHCSGWLLDRIRKNNPDVFANMKSLTAAGAIAWISAGYYEPVLSSIPSKDRQAQIKKMNKYIKKYLEVKPKGLWLTERVWESSIVPDIVLAGNEFVVVDDYHFLSSGFDADKMDGYYKTEESGVELGLFPISQALRYALPFFSVERSIETILSCKKNENSAAIIFDDAEKFGLWPKTHEWVYEKGWLSEFVEAVINHKDIQTQHYSEYMKNNNSLGLAYLNNTSYFEMGEWSLKARQTLALEHLKKSLGDEYFNSVGVAFIKGGIWKNFFIKYLESNYLHKRMLNMSLNQDAFDKKSLEALYKLQTNDVFWHGVFGGLYLPNLRDNAYRYLLEIEKSRARKKVQFEVLDIDKDGEDELKVITQNLSLVFSSKFGGQMIEFGSFETLFNWQNTLMRREEAYHEKILHPQVKTNHNNNSGNEIETIHNDATVIDASLKDELIYDWHPKYSFINHFSEEAFSLDNFKHLTFKEVGDFANQAFILEKNRAKFVREGGFYLGKTYRTKTTQKYDFDDNGITAKINVKSEYAHSLFHAMEFNFHFAHPNKVTFNSKTLEDGFVEENCDELIIVDDFTNKILKLTIDRKCNIYGFILNTISQSESGFEKVAQGVSFVFTSSFKSTLNLNVKIEVLNV
ncbi:alpha-amylase/4-alpha-glucanotransferase domain-containing protein [Sulfurimonas sp.]